MKSFRIRGSNGESFHAHADFENPQDFALHLHEHGFANCRRYQMGRSGPTDGSDIVVMASYVGTIELGNA